MKTWLNLKNSWDNQKRVKNMWTNTYIDEITIALSALAFCFVAYQIVSNWK